MYENTEPWQTSVPADLIPAIKHLRETFDGAYWRCGQTTGAFCYALLHNQGVDDLTGQYRNHLGHINARVGPAAARRCTDLMEAGTPSAIFEAFYGLYLTFVNTLALPKFNDFMEIGRVHEKSLAIPHLEWAEAQAKHLIRSHCHDIGDWVRYVCDKQVCDRKADSEERILWRKWQAPTFLNMKPLRDKPYDAATAWERNDAGVSSQWLEYFKDHFVLILESNVERASGKAALELARRSKPIVPGAAENDIVSRYTPTKTRREARKLDTQDMYKSWQKDYQKLKKLRPEMSDVWCAQRIASKTIARHKSVETIRKNMKK